MAKIETLIDDIVGVLSTPTTVSDDDAAAFGRAVANIVSTRLANHDSTPSLRMSNIGSPCQRKLYYTVNNSGERERLPAQVRLKFIYGDILEALLLLLAKSAGHLVEGEQDEVEINGVKGHRDAIIDGTTVDCKSASPFSFKKFESGLVPGDDAFGYLDQLGGYVYAAQSDSRVADKDRGAFLVVDKVSGQICLDIHHVGHKDYNAIVEQRKAVVQRGTPPARPYFDEPDGKSGNRKLGTVCSYCDFRQHCWQGLQGYAYSNGPRYLTVVNKVPDVPRIF